MRPTIERIYHAWERHLLAGSECPEHIVVSSETWWLVQGEVSSPYVLSPDSGNSFMIFGMEVHIAEVDDEIFLA